MKKGSNVNRKELYSGYEAYQYLEKDKDYKAFKMAAQINRVPECLIPLTEEQEKRVLKINQEFIQISLHDHPTMIPFKLSELFEYKHQGRDETAYEGLLHSTLDCVFDNMMDGNCTITSKMGWKWEDIIFDLGMRLCDLAHQDYIIHCKKVKDIYRAHKEGRLALAFAIEGSSPIENELDRIDILYGFGVRMMGITYNESNNLGSGLKEKKDGGLSSFGEKAVERMNKVGMAIDCSHTGIQTTLDVIEASQKPIFLSHIGAQALWNSKRLTPDEVLVACAKKGGVVGIEAAPHTTITEEYQEHSIESYMQHFNYIKKLIGIEHVAFGPDTLYGDHVGLHQIFAKYLSTNKIQKIQSFKKVEYVKGMENPTEASKNVIRWLVKESFSNEDIEKVLSKNILRVLNEVWY